MVLPLVGGRAAGGPAVAAAPRLRHVQEPAACLLRVPLGPRRGYGVSEVGQQPAGQLSLCLQGDEGLESIGKGWKK